MCQEILIVIVCGYNKWIGPLDQWEKKCGCYVILVLKFLNWQRQINIQ